MSSVDLEKYVPRLSEVRAQERQNRALAFAGLTHTVCGREVLPLTPGHRLQLQLVGNAFACASESVSLVDVFVFLWVTSPKNTGSGIEAARQQYFLRQDVEKFDLQASSNEITRYVIDQMQDVNDGSNPDGPDKSAWIHWAAMDAEFWVSVHGGFTVDQYLRTPYVVLHQLLRAWRVNHPDMEHLGNGKVITREPMFVNASDRLVRQWHNTQREAVKRIILSQKERRN